MHQYLYECAQGRAGKMDFAFLIICQVSKNYFAWSFDVTKLNDVGKVVIYYITKIDNVSRSCYLK